MNVLERIVWVPIFFGHAKFEVKKFSEFFHLHSTVNCELNFLHGGVLAPTFFGHTKF